MLHELINKLAALLEGASNAGRLFTRLSEVYYPSLEGPGPGGF